MNDHRQAELLEQYLISLRSNPDALPPADLDPVVAELARKFKQQPAARPNQAAKARMWQRTMAASRNQAPFSTYSLAQLQQEAEAKEVRPPRVVYPVTLSAAVIAVTLFFAAMLIFGGNPPGNNPSLAGSTETTADIENTQTAAVSTATPTDTQIVATEEATMQIIEIENPATLFARTEPVMTTSIGSVQVGRITPGQPVVSYDFQVAENGIGIARVESDDFIAALYYSVQLSSLQRTEGVATSQDVVKVGSGAGVQDNVLFVSRNPNPIWFPTAKGAVIQLHVAAAVPGEVGDFRLITQWLPPVQIAMNQPQTFSFSPAQPFAYYTFQGKPGERLRLDINGEQPRQAFLFSEARPLRFDVWQGTADDYPPLIVSQNEVYGIVVGPDDVTSSGSFSIKLEAEPKP